MELHVLPEPPDNEDPLCDEDDEEPVLDEATSALDCATEAALLATLDKVATGRTVIHVTHRLSSVVEADHILLLDHGRVREEGTHEELLEQNGLSAALWWKQHRKGAFKKLPVGALHSATTPGYTGKHAATAPRRSPTRRLTMFTAARPRRPLRSFVRLLVEELESRALLSEVGGAVWIGATGKPYPGARITLFTPDLAYFREARADEQGGFWFTDVPNGSYQLGVAGRGYEYEEVPVTLKDAKAYEWFELEPETQPGQWSFIGDIAPEVLGGTGSATLLANGDEVFICHDSLDPIIFNFRTGEKRFPPSSQRQSQGHATTLLSDGRVFIAGGGNGVGGGPGGADPRLLRQAKTFDPASNTWTNLADMNVPRWYPSIVRLPYDQLLVFGGDTSQGRTNTAEVYDLASNTWTLVGNFRRAQDMPPAMLLPSGEVLKTWRDPELFSLATWDWRDAAPFLQDRVGVPGGGHSDHMSILFPDGRVGMFGIETRADERHFTEIYDPLKNTWTVGASPLVMRQQVEAMLLPGGQVLAYGGQYTGIGPAPVPLGEAGSVRNLARVTDLYNPVTDSWRRLADLNRFVHFHSLGLLLPDGRVLDTGGAGRNGPFGDDPRVEAFQPPYLFRGVRPQIDTVSATTLTAGETFSLQVSRTESVSEVLLLGMRATTHWIDGGTNRYLSLDFQQQGSDVTATVPADQLQALSGWYMLFVMVDDIPSEARLVRIADLGRGPGLPDVPQSHHAAEFDVQVDDHPHLLTEHAHSQEPLSNEAAGALVAALHRAVPAPVQLASDAQPQPVVAANVSAATDVTDSRRTDGFEACGSWNEIRKEHESGGIDAMQSENLYSLLGCEVGFFSSARS